MTSFLDGYLPYLLQRADQTLSARFHRYLADEGVQTSEWRVLAVLAETGPLAVGALTRLTLLPQPTTTHAVRRLEERGHVRRRTDRHDGRLRIVELTARGRRRADQLIAAADRELARTISDAGFDVSDGLVADLRRLVDALGAPT